MIVSPHGGGLANLIWCNRNTQVVEIIPKDKLNNFYETGSPNPSMLFSFPGMPKGLTLQQRLENFNAKQAGSPQPHRDPFNFNRRNSRG